MTSASSITDFHWVVAYQAQAMQSKTCVLTFSDTSLRAMSLLVALVTCKHGGTWEWSKQAFLTDRLSKFIQEAEFQFTSFSPISLEAVQQSKKGPLQVILCFSTEIWNKAFYNYCLSGHCDAVNFIQEKGAIINTLNCNFNFLLEGT